MPLALVLLIALFIAEPCYADLTTGKQLLSWCQSDPTQADLYISAFNDTAQVARAQADESAIRTPRNATAYDEIFHRYIGRFCIPRRGYVKTTETVCRWLSIHNDDIGMPAPRIIARAYQSAFPCLDE